MLFLHPTQHLPYQFPLLLHRLKEFVPALLRLLKVFISFISVLLEAFELQHLWMSAYPDFLLEVVSFSVLEFSEPGLS